MGFFQFVLQVLDLGNDAVGKQFFQLFTALMILVEFVTTVLPILLFSLSLQRRIVLVIDLILAIFLDSRDLLLQFVDTVI